MNMTHYEINEDKIITLKYTACAVTKRSRDSYMNIPHFVFILLWYVTNRPFLSYLGPLYQNEVKCSAFDKEMIFHYHANKNSFSQERLCTWPHFESEGFWNSKVAYSEFIDQLPAGLLAYLVRALHRHCRVQGLNLGKEEFFRLSFRNYISCILTSDDLLCI